MPLRRYENQAPRPREGAEAAMMLGQVHYARGEYRRARRTEALFGQALAFEQSRRPERAFETLE